MAYGTTDPYTQPQKSPYGVSPVSVYGSDNAPPQQAQPADIQVQAAPQDDQSQSNANYQKLLGMASQAQNGGSTPQIGSAGSGYQKISNMIGMFG